MQREPLSAEALLLADPPERPSPASEPGDALASLLAQRPAAVGRAPLPEVVIGQIVAITGDGLTPLVLYPGQPGSAALAARTTLDLHGAHVGRPAVLSFEGGDPARPIVTGVVREAGDSPLEAPGQVQVQADGARLIVDAKQELVLRCGKASITLTRAGKVLIQGSYVSSRSTGVNRIRGGSVQLN